MVWPEEIVVLDESCNISGPYGEQTEGYPNSITEWINFSFRTPDASNHLDALEWWSTHEYVNKWYNAKRQLRDQEFVKYLQTCPYLSKETALAILLPTKVLYNLTWCIHGYTEGQDEWTLGLLDLLNSDPLFQKLKDGGNIPPPITNRLFKNVTQKEPTKPKGNAGKKDLFGNPLS